MRISSGAPAVAVALNSACPTPDTMACTVLAPTEAPSVQVVAARPLPSVVPVGGSTEPPPAVTTQVTAAPVTGFPSPSTTWTTRSSGSVVPGGACWSSPDTIVTPDALPGVAVWLKMTGDPASPSEPASVVWAPAAGPRVRVTELRPWASVTVEAALTLPPPSAVQVIVTPSVGLPKPSVTSTTSGSGNSLPTTPDCSSPETSARPLADAATAVTVKLAWTSAGLSGAMTRTRPEASPTSEPRVISALPRPWPSVLSVSGSATAPESSTTTVAPGTGRSAPSNTWTTSDSARTSPTRPLEPFP